MSELDKQRVVTMGEAIGERAVYQAMLQGGRE